MAGHPAAQPAFVKAFRAVSNAMTPGEVVESTVIGQHGPGTVKVQGRWLQDGQHCSAAGARLSSFARRSLQLVPASTTTPELPPELLLVEPLLVPPLEPAVPPLLEPPLAPLLEPVVPPLLDPPLLEPAVPPLLDPLLLDPLPLLMPVVPLVLPPLPELLLPELAPSPADPSPPSATKALPPHASPKTTNAATKAQRATSTPLSDLPMLHSLRLVIAGRSCNRPVKRAVGRRMKGCLLVGSV
jgi:hypothetical protein